MSKSVYSTVTSWTIRILLFLLVISAVGLFMLSMLGGTSESHRRGLGQAFSDTLNAKVEVGRLDAFNVVPDLQLKAGDIKGTLNTSGRDFMADSVTISFSFWNLLKANRKIENFQLENFRFSSDTGNSFRIERAGINPGDAPEFSAKGEYDGKRYDMTFALRQDPGIVPQYYFDRENPVRGSYGGLMFKGTIVPASNAGSQILKDTVIEASGRKIATASSVRDEKGSVVIEIQCASADIPSPAKADFKSLATADFFKISPVCLP